MDKQVLEHLVNENLSTYQIGERLNLSQNTIRYWLKKFDLKTNKKQFKQHVNWSELQLREAVKNSKTISQVIQKLELRHSSGNYRTINKYVGIYDIDKSHFCPGEFQNPKFVRRHSFDEILVENSSYQWTTNLKKRLIEEGLLQEVCSNLNCRISEWNGKKIVLQLDHINGHRTDNRLENLRLLCPNCHSQTETFSRRTK